MKFAMLLEQKIKRLKAASARSDCNMYICKVLCPIDCMSFCCKNFLLGGEDINKILMHTPAIYLMIKICYVCNLSIV